MPKKWVSFCRNCGKIDHFSGKNALDAFHKVIKACSVKKFMPGQNLKK